MIKIERDSKDIFDKRLIFNLEDIGQRIRISRSQYNLSQCEFASGLHISRKWLSELENGKKCPSGLFLLGIECRYSVSRDWILDGKGAMLISSDQGGKSPAEMMLLDAFGKLSENGKEKILNIINTFLFIDEN